MKRIVILVSFFISLAFLKYRYIFMLLTILLLLHLISTT